MNTDSKARRLAIIVVAAMFGTVIVVIWRGCANGGGRVPGRTDFDDLGPNHAQSPSASDLSQLTPGGRLGLGHDAEPADGTTAAIENPIEPIPFSAKTEPIRVTTFHIQDICGVPAQGATVAVKYYRTNADPPRLLLPPVETKTFTTDVSGNATIPYHPRINSDLHTDALTIRVSHPEFASRLATVFVERPSPVILERSARVIVAVVDRFGQRISKFDVYVEPGAALDPSAWTPTLDGRMQTFQLEAGRHRIWIETDVAGKRLFSAVSVVEVAMNDISEHTIEVEAGTIVEGIIDPIVPRPVQGGKVRLFVHQSNVPPSSKAVVTRSILDTCIREDGTFEFDNVPAGTCEVFALCPGWTSTRTTQLNQEQVDAFALRETDLERRARLLEFFAQMQRFVVPSSAPIQIGMERTGRLALQVQDASGKRLRAMRVRAAPTFVVLPDQSLVVPWREWETQTDAQGMVTYEDLPPTHALTMSVFDNNESSAIARIGRESTAIIRSGETTDALIVVHPH